MTYVCFSNFLHIGHDLPNTSVHKTFIDRSDTKIRSDKQASTAGKIGANSTSNFVAQIVISNYNFPCCAHCGLIVTMNMLYTLWHSSHNEHDAHIVILWHSSHNEHVAHIVLLWHSSHNGLVVLIMA